MEHTSSAGSNKATHTLQVRFLDIPDIREVEKIEEVPQVGNRAKLFVLFAPRFRAGCGDRAR